MNRLSATCRPSGNELARRTIAPATTLANATAMTDLSRWRHGRANEPVASGSLTAISAPDTSGGRQLVTILLADIVGSTQCARRLGDAAWSRLLRQFYAAAEHVVGAGGGRIVKTTGDGFLAVFGGPGRAIESANATLMAVKELGLSARAGVHTAEVEVIGDDVAGIGVHIAARVSQAAHDGELWVSRTVRDVVAGSGVSFAERGRQSLDGLDEAWDLYAVVG